MLFVVVVVVEEQIEHFEEEFVGMD